MDDPYAIMLEAVINRAFQQAKGTLHDRKIIYRFATRKNKLLDYYSQIYDIDETKIRKALIQLVRQ